MSLCGMSGISRIPAPERIIAPDATELLDYMLNRFTRIVDTLTVFEDNMRDNIYKTYGVIFSQRFMLTLIERECRGSEAYDLGPAERE